MITYEKLLEIAEQEGIDIDDEYELSGRNEGLLYDGFIAVKKDLTIREKKCILAEELGHHFTTVGNILDQRNVINRKREKKGRIYAYNLLIGLDGLIECYHECVSNTYEMAEVLDVTEEFLKEALAYYTGKFGIGVQSGKYYIQFIPYLAVILKTNNQDLMVD